MTTRTTSKTITFHRPFCVKGVDRLLPPANYQVATNEEVIEGLSFQVYRRISTEIFVPTQSGSAIEMLTIDPLDLQAAKERDARERIDCGYAPVID
ncbi:MAG: hypothetical protein ACXWC0_30745 [Burkholderiales bacterium]